MKKKIALYVPSLRGGGAERVMVTLANGFVAQNYDVDLVLAKAQGPYLSDVALDVCVINLKSEGVFKSLPGLIRYLRRERPDAMLSAMTHANIVAIFARILSGTAVRLVLSEHRIPRIIFGIQNSRKQMLLYLLLRKFYRRVDAVVGVSQGVSREVMGLGKIDGAKVHTIYNPIYSESIITKSKSDIDYFESEYSGKKTIIAAGRITAEKDFSTLIQAFSIFRKKKDAGLIILGDGEERVRLEALVRHLGISDDVKFPGFVSNPYAYMRRASVFVLSSVYEGFGNVLVEAMAVGVPVVSTRCPSGPEEILENGEWGRLVPVGEPELLAEAMLSAIDDPRDTAIGRAKEFSVDNAVKKYLDVLFPVE